MVTKMLRKTQKTKLKNTNIKHTKIIHKSGRHYYWCNQSLGLINECRQVMLAMAKKAKAMWKRMGIKQGCQQVNTN